MRFRACIPLALALALAGCQTSGEPSDVERQAQILAAVPSNYRQVVPLAFRAIVPDPAGIRTSEISTPFLGALDAGTESPLVCVRVQYANGPDGQSGGQTFAFGFRDGQVTDSRRSSPACATATYSLFPELRSAYPGFGAPAS